MDKKIQPAIAAATPAPAAVAAGLQQAQRQAFIRGWDERGKAHDLAPAVTTDRFMRELLDVYFPPTAPAQEHASQLASRVLHDIEACAEVMAAAPRAPAAQKPTP